MPNAWGKSLPRLNRQTRKGGMPHVYLINRKNHPKGEGRVGKKLTAVDVQLTIVLSTRKMYFETVFLSFYRQTEATGTTNTK